MDEQLKQLTDIKLESNGWEISAWYLEQELAEARDWAIRMKKKSDSWERWARQLENERKQQNRRNEVRTRSNWTGWND